MIQTRAAPSAPSAPSTLLDHSAGHEILTSSATADCALETLTWLLRYPLLRSNDLATLMGLSNSAAASRLTRARAEGRVQTIPAPLLGRHEARLYALTPLGLDYLANQYGALVWQQARRTLADTSGLLNLILNLPGLLVTQSFVLGLIAHAQASNSPHVVLDARRASTPAPHKHLISSVAPIYDTL
jgi:hypothetical protein